MDRNETHAFISKPERASARGVMLTFMIAVGIFAVSTGTAKVFFPLAAGLKQRKSDSAQEGAQPQTLVSRTGTGYTTMECTGNTDLPVLEGADVVAYYSLEDGEPAKIGKQDHTSNFNGYKFWFISRENKALFEERPWYYMPAWGAFCSWGIAMESWWTKDTLGPDADPNWWMITQDGVLHLFRSETPKMKFTANTAANTEKGNAIWQGWFGEEAPGAYNTGSPLNTACFCDVSTCTDA